MATTTSIEWATATYNPWIGCRKVSPGCTNCYAEVSPASKFKRVKWGKGQPRYRTKTAPDIRKLNRKAGKQRCEKCNCKQVEHGPGLLCKSFVGPRPRVFCASLADWLDPEIPVEWLADLLALIVETPFLDWLMLTKRPELWRERMNAVLGLRYRPDAPLALQAAKSLASLWVGHSPPKNVWMLTTVENQAMADKRIPELLKIPALVRGLSMEPLLEEVDLGRWLERIDHCVSCGEENTPQGPDVCPACGSEGSLVSTWGYEQADQYPSFDDEDDGPKLHWVICGGESGPNARPMHPGWARSLRDQCQAAGVPYLFKQWGACSFDRTAQLRTAGGQAARGGILRDPAGDLPYWRVGKKAAGRELDGRTWDEFPEVRA